MGNLKQRRKPGNKPKIENSNLKSLKKSVPVAPTSQSNSFLRNVLIGAFGLLAGSVGWKTDDNFWVAVTISLTTAVLCTLIIFYTDFKRLIRFILCASCISFSSLLFWLLKDTNYQKELTAKYINERQELKANSGTLYPAALPRPKPDSPTCDIPSNDFAVFAGTGSVAFGASLPQTILSIKGQEIIGADSFPDGSLKLRTLRLFDDRNDIITRIENNELWVSPSARKSRPDKSTLIVYDHNDQQVLLLKVLNINTLYITGVFRVKGSVTIEVTDKNIKFGSNAASGLCAAGARHIALAFN